MNYKLAVIPGDAQKRDAARLREAGDAGITLRGQSREPFFRNGRMALRL